MKFESAPSGFLDRPQTLPFPPAPQIEPPADWTHVPRSEHLVEFYDDESFLVQSVAAFIAAGLEQGEAGLIIATAAHGQAICERLGLLGLDIHALQASQKLQLLDAADTLAKLMKDGSPEQSRFEQSVGQAVAQATTGGRPLRAFGEMVALLWKNGNGEGAIRLEELWNALAKKHTFSLLCAYPMGGFCSEAHSKAFTQICNAHSRVIPAESYSVNHTEDERAREISLLQQRAAVLQSEIAQRKAAEEELRRTQQEHLADLRAITLLYDIGNECLRADAQEGPCLQRILDAAITITGAAKGTIQLLDPASNKLVLAVQRGFDPSFVEIFAGIAEEQAAACATAKRTGQRIIVEDITKSAVFAGQPALEILLSAGVRAVQATPLVSSAGTVLGMISTHFLAPHNIAGRELRLLDLLARQAGDYLERKRAGEGLALLAAIVENSEDAIITKNQDGFITSWNKGAERMFGYTVEETIGRHVSLLIPADRLEEEPGILARLRRGERIEHFETVRRRKDGTLLDISLTVSPIRGAGGQIIGASKIARDVTELRKAREALTQSHQQLEQRVAERTASLEQAIVQMEEFTYSVSHDLRAPVRIIRGVSQAAIDDYGASMTPDLRKLLDKISGSAQRMEQLIRDILDYSRMARAEVKACPVDLDRLVTAIVAERPDMQPPRATIQLHSPLQRVLAHEPSLSQAITNLLANAVKFVPPGGQPKVELWTEPRNGSVRLWVKDRGIGINPKYHHRLFQLFERAHNCAQYEGTGIGLAIVRKAAEKMGGKVGVVSDGASGSSFWIELPAAIS